MDRERPAWSVNTHPTVLPMPWHRGRSEVAVPLHGQAFDEAIGADRIGSDP